jgi:hypothetical protein
MLLAGDGVKATLSWPQLSAPDELSFKIMELVGARQEHDEVVLQSSNLLIC